MSRQHLLIWCGFVLVLLALVYVLSDILLPFILALAIAYFLDPLVDRLQRLRCSRLVATLIVTAFIGLFAIAASYWIIPQIFGQVSAFVAALPALVDSFRASLVAQLSGWVGESSASQLQVWLGEVGDSATVTQKLSAWILQQAPTLLHGTLALVNLLAVMFVTPVVTFYLLLDWDRMTSTIFNYIPVQSKALVRDLARDVDEVLSNFVRGQVTLCITMGCYYAIALSMLSLPYAIVVGLAVGMISFIPFVGFGVGMVLSVGIAVPEYGLFGWITLITIGVFLIGQFIEGNILQPNLVGFKVGLHPVWVMFSLFAFGYLYGFVGMLLAIPLAAAARVLISFGLKSYLDSTLYDANHDVR